jgi:hypothetical protein
VAFFLPTLSAQPSRLVRLPMLEDVADPTSATLARIESSSGDSTGGAQPRAPRNGAFELYRWDRFPAVLVFDMADFAEQDRMFSRLAFFIEKRGYRGRLLMDAQLAGKHGWNAHDYGSEGLAAFFSAAAKARFPLDAEELLLRGIALREGIIARGDATGGAAAAGEVGGASQAAEFLPGFGAVLSISRSSSKYERNLLLSHESYHGVYFCSEEYRALCDRLWNEAPASERLFMTRLLGALGYDPGSRDLVVNEFQAYLLQQPRSVAASYFERVGKLVADQAGVPTAAEVLPALLKDEAVLEDFLRSRFSIEAGGAVLEPEAGG